MVNGNPRFPLTITYHGCPRNYLFALGYSAAIMARNNVGLAALQMNRDLHFSASIYGFGAGLFSIGYALWS
jgi:sugar phosphate permease